MSEPTPEELAAFRRRWDESNAWKRITLLPPTPKARPRWHDWLDTALVAFIAVVDLLWLVLK